MFLKFFFKVWKVPMLALEKEWVTSLLFYFQDTPTAKFAITPLTWSTFSAIICIITSSVPKLTFIPECAQKPLSSSKFSTGPSWILTKRPWTCLEVAPQLLVKTTQSWANRQKTRQKLDCEKFVKLTDHTFMPPTVWQIFNEKCIQQPETDVMWIWWKLFRKTRDITSSELIFGGFYDVRKTHVDYYSAGPMTTNLWFFLSYCVSMYLTFSMINNDRFLSVPIF